MLIYFCDFYPLLKVMFLRYIDVNASICINIYACVVNTVCFGGNIFLFSILLLMVIRSYPAWGYYEKCYE